MDPFRYIARLAAVFAPAERRQVYQRQKSSDAKRGQKNLHDCYPFSHFNVLMMLLVLVLLLLLLIDTQCLLNLVQMNRVMVSPVLKPGFGGELANLRLEPHALPISGTK